MVAEGVGDVKAWMRSGQHIYQQPDKYNLETITQENQEMNTDDAYLILYHHWALDTSVSPNEHDGSYRYRPACLRVQRTRHSALLCTITN